ncbi:MAG: hypothetical protein QM708_06105 [Propioniciclava sp.]|uniref:hypothetical protein n=1 Tax=Propioniciclava sp. TaxID=2038686 RepID=UPI0039E2D64E
MSDQTAAEAPAIATLRAPTDASIDPKTGEPRRPIAVWAASVLLHLGVALVMAGLLWAFWLSIDTFEQAAWLHGVVPTEPGALLRVLMVTALFTIAMLIAVASVIAAHYAWHGYGWTRRAGLIAVAVSLLALMINPLATWGILPIATGAGLLWLPSVRGFFQRWHARRHPEPPPVTEASGVFYGPLPRYR